MATASIANHEPITIVLRGHPPQPFKTSEIVSEGIRNVRPGPRHDEQLCWFLAHPFAPESVLLDFCDRGEFLTELGHRKGPLSLLERLAERGQREAILSLGLAYYQDPAHDRETFEGFLGRYGKDTWLLETLARAQTVSEEKKAALTVYVNSTGVFREPFEEIERSTRLASLAAEVTDPEALQQLHASGDPNVLRQIAANPATPEELLRQLADLKGIKHAVEIRTLARGNLSRRGIAR